MPSGLTCDIKNDQSFRNFVLTCSRQFGALIHMRDDEIGPHVKHRTPSDYHDEQIKKLSEELKEIESMIDEEVSARCYSEYNSAVEHLLEREEQDQILKFKYENMLKKAYEWIPPTQDHVNLKELMIDQLKKSIEWDCSYKYSTPERLTPKEWKNTQIKRIKDSIKYHEKSAKEEIERCNGANAWIDALLASLPEE